MSPVVTYNLRDDQVARRFLRLIKGALFYALRRRAINYARLQSQHWQVWQPEYVQRFHRGMEIQRQVTSGTSHSQRTRGVCSALQHKRSKKLAPYMETRWVQGTKRQDMKYDDDHADDCAAASVTWRVVCSLLLGAFEA